MARQALSAACLRLVLALESDLAPALERTRLKRLRVGLSGGADSLALLAGLEWATCHRQGPLRGVPVEARVVDHGLQEGSGAVAQRAREQAEGLGVPAEVVLAQVDSGSEGVEAAARSARYQTLFSGPEALVVVGHTLDDQAETVLLGLARGSGVRSLAGMAPLSARTWGDEAGWLARPLLSLRRADTEQACRDWGLTWWDDPMNADSSYTRSAVRAAMPMLEDVLGPGLSEGLARTAILARQDADYLDELVEDAGVSPESDSLSVADLISLPPALRTRVILKWLRTRSDQVTYDHVMAVDSLLTDWHGQKGISVPGGLVRRANGSLLL
ncbi:MAG: tRNA lysidine(34) synthetase TilS [Propionibacteriaceae bacterium]|nr:tRNA lysidine(34) synthetase TilS [Propionibacteriaceae bacterium]